ncbi:MAG: alginate lyase family protein, partial [Candidatus Polarisedimenticolia bacterium]
ALLRRLAPTTETAEARARLRAGDPDGAALRLLRGFRAGVPDRFFAGATPDAGDAVQRVLLQDAREEAVTAAASILRGQFDLLGYRGLSFGDPIDWHLDPVSGKRAPIRHWGGIDPLDAGRVGDSKVVWELNRHQWMVRLAQAYRLTGKEGYAAAIVGHARHWLAANPAGIGINWSSSLEVALRLIAWCWTLSLIRDAAALTPRFFLEILAAIDAHATHVERFLSRYFSPNTHLTGEALGLVYAGFAWPELRAAPRWRRLGARLLEEQIARQVLPDGVHFERSTCYQRYTAEIYLHFLILSERHGVGAAPGVAAGLRRLLDALLALRLPDGSSPPIGDADGGWILPFARRDPGDLRGIFGVAAARFRRPEYAWAAGGAAPEVLWLLGSSGLEAFRQLRPCAPAAEPSRLLPDGGFAILRDGWGAGAHQLILDAGPLGCPVSAGHGHAGLLGIQCAAFGEPFIVDPGTGCYTGDSEWRDHFRSTAAHSSVLVDGRGQAVPAGPFGWVTRPRARLRRFVATGAYDFADAGHDAYGRLADPVLHRRRAIFVKPRYFVIVDDLLGGGEHAIELRLQLAPVRVTLEAPLWARATGDGPHGLLVRPFAAVPLQAALLEGRTAPIAGWVSADYGRRRPAPLLVYRARARLPVRLVTLILPIADAAAPLPEVAPLRGDGPVPDGLVIRLPGLEPETVRLEEDGVRIGRS